jgi:hypothetical protein
VSEQIETLSLALYLRKSALNLLQNEFFFDLNLKFVQKLAVLNEVMQTNSFNSLVFAFPMNCGFEQAFYH